MTFRSLLNRLCDKVTELVLSYIFRNVKPETILKAIPPTYPEKFSHLKNNAENNSASSTNLKLVSRCYGYAGERRAEVQQETHSYFDKSEQERKEWTSTEVHSFCPNCSRPVKLVYEDDKKWWEKNSEAIEDTNSSTTGENDKISTAQTTTAKKYAFCVTLWGENMSYVIGAAVLGHSLRKHSKNPNIDRVVLHTADVPEFGKIILEKSGWKLIEVDHLKCSNKHFLFPSDKGRFEHVFTKLQCFKLTQYEKVCMLDIDMMAFGNIDDIFDLPAPAAFKRGNAKLTHGERIDGASFFGGPVQKYDSNYSEFKDNWYGAGSEKHGWGQFTGINAGIMVLPTDKKLYEEVVVDIQDDGNPSHIGGTGPEQDYLSRMFADKWVHIDVTYNCQVHQLFIALAPVSKPEFASMRAQIADGIGEHYQTAKEKSEKVDFYTKTEESTKDKSSPDYRLPTQCRKNIKIIHYSGDHMTKPWDFVLSGIAKDAGKWRGYESDSIRKKEINGLKSFIIWWVFDKMQGYKLWARKDAKWWKRLKESDHFALSGFEYNEETGEITNTHDDTIVNANSDAILGVKAVIYESYLEWYLCFLELAEEIPILHEAHRLGVKPYYPMFWFGSEDRNKNDDDYNNYDNYKYGSKNKYDEEEKEFDLMTNIDKVLGFDVETVLKQKKYSTDLLDEIAKDDPKLVELFYQTVAKHEEKLAKKEEEEAAKKRDWELREKKRILEEEKAHLKNTENADGSDSETTSDSKKSKEFKQQKKIESSDVSSDEQTDGIFASKGNSKNSDVKNTVGEKKETGFFSDSSSRSGRADSDSE